MYGANIPGNTIADMLQKNSVHGLGQTLLAVTPGGSHDRGRDLDADELVRIARMLDEQNIPFIVPENITAAVVLRESLFNDKGCTLLINSGGNHASHGDSMELVLLAGVLKPDKIKTFQEDGLVQRFLAAGKPVIQILNVRKLYNSYGLDYNEDGILLSGGQKLLRWKRLPLPVLVLPVLCMIIILWISRLKRNN